MFHSATYSNTFSSPILTRLYLYSNLLYFIFPSPSHSCPFVRSHDVLNLIGKILSFSEEQLKIVGLKDRPMSMLDTILSTVLPFTPEGLQVL